MLLDLWHLLEHIPALARVLWPNEQKQRAAFRREFRDVVRDDGGAAGLAWLDARAPAPGPVAHAKYVEERACVESNLPDLNYRLAIEPGLPVGSGMIESACKEPVTQRLKGPGMAWKPENAANLANLRAIFVDGRWKCPSDLQLSRQRLPA